MSWVCDTKGVLPCSDRSRGNGSWWQSIERRWDVEIQETDLSTDCSTRGSLA